ncbi:hypothetical protein BGW80DRAFT_1532711 [Lactifluus volemus]|nr:hypothetical protein BGW80DRAFT_1532711 [Lactifluus volemus]
MQGTIQANLPQEEATPETIAVVKDQGPVALSFPSILRNPGLTSRFAHLVEPTQLSPDPSSVQSKKVWRRNDNEGKRWVRRRENARFTHNPHIATPSKRDLNPSVPSQHATFPIPLPPYLPRSAPLPATVPPVPDTKASNAGQFNLSLRGMRKALRRSGARTQALVRGVEDELMRWLGEVEVVLNPDAGIVPPAFQFPGRVIAGEEGIREVERSPRRLVWWIENDAWARFSKDTPTHRLTHILRPNATRPDPATRTALATPPTTDADFSSLSSFDSDIHSIDGNSEVLSESDFASEGDDVESAARGQRRVTTSVLSDIASDVDADVETSSAIDGNGGGDSDLERATEALSLVNDDETPRPPLREASSAFGLGNSVDEACESRLGDFIFRSFSLKRRISLILKCSDFPPVACQSIPPASVNQLIIPASAGSVWERPDESQAQVGVKGSTWITIEKVEVSLVAGEVIGETERDRAAQNALASGSPGHFITINELAKTVEPQEVRARRGGRRKKGIEDQQVCVSVETPPENEEETSDSGQGGARRSATRFSEFRCHWQARANHKLVLRSGFGSEEDDVGSAARGQRVTTGTSALSNVASGVDADVETEALSLVNDVETPRPPLRTQAGGWDRPHHTCSGSSPSRPPARRKSHWPLGRAIATAKKLANRDNDSRKDNFYNYLFE